MYKADSLIVLRYFKYSGVDEVSIRNLNLSNDFELRNRYFYNNEGFRRLSGILSLLSFEKSSFIYSVDNFITYLPPPFKTIEDFVQRMNNSFFNNIDEYMYFLWFVKDNSVSIDSCTTYLENCEQLILKEPNYNVATNSIGFHEDIEWSIEELEQAGTFLDLYNQIPRVKKRKVIENLPLSEMANKIAMSSVNQYNYNDWADNRIQRAFGFLRNVRYCSVLINKIAYYVPLLESLFVDTKRGSDLKAKVSKRSANYIASTIEEAKDIQQQVRNLYDVRSDYFHGTTIKSKLSSISYLQNLSKEIDALCRKILTKILTSDSQAFLSNDVDKFLKNLEAKTFTI